MFNKNMIQGSITVLVTGVGAIIGQGIIKSLRKSYHQVKVVGIDRSDKSLGPSLCDVFFKKPDCDEDHLDYLTFWRWMLKKEGIDLVLPGLEVDVTFFDKQREVFEQVGVVVALNHKEIIELSSDKWVMGEVLQRYGLPRIPSLIPMEWCEAVAELGPPPLLFKPKQGNGSRGIHYLNDEADFHYWRSKVNDNWMLQRIVGSDLDEYTVGVFGLGDGLALKPIVFRRRLSSAGNTLEAEVVEDSDIESSVMLLTKLFRPLGPTNYQFRKEGGVVYLLEINPRFSSSNSLRTAFGYNEAEMSIDYFLFGKVPADPKIKKGIAWRYSEDFVIHDSNFI
ncbi:MAG: carbamoyl-phosphate synthase subunit L [Methylomarinum sp.]|nr:carbamoyl-phosphate synthase subunit L [Methylomarinum sp.]